MFVECSVPTSSAKDVTIKKTRMCGDALTSLINNQICSSTIWAYHSPFFHIPFGPWGKIGQCGQNNRDILHHKVSNERYGYPLSIGIL